MASAVRADPVDRVLEPLGQDPPDDLGFEQRGAELLRPAAARS